jgi:predicted dinucleotide-binding enzyme
VARHLVDAGQEVAIANSRGPESLAGFVAELGPNAQAATVTGAAGFAPIDVGSLADGRGAG